MRKCPIPYGFARLHLFYLALEAPRVQDQGRGTFAGEVLQGNFCRGTFVRELLMGNFCMGTFARGSFAGELLQGKFCGGCFAWESFAMEVLYLSER